MSTLASVTAQAAAPLINAQPMGQVTLVDPNRLSTASASQAQSVAAAPTPPARSEDSRFGDPQSGKSPTFTAGYGADGSPADDGQPHRTLVDVKV